MGVYAIFSMLSLFMKNIKEERACPALQEGVCFPGCFCPDGLVKDGNRCIEPTKCKNCNAKIKDKCEVKYLYVLGICKKKPGISYITFDGKHVRMEEDRKYILSILCHTNLNLLFDMQILLIS